MIEPVEVSVGSGRVVQAYDTAGQEHDTAGPEYVTGSGPVLLWHHGTPHTGRPLPPVLDLCAARGVRLITYARPGYGASTPLPGRDVASVAEEVTAVLDAFGVGRVVTMGASGGGPPSLACGALLGDRSGPR